MSIVDRNKTQALRPVDSDPDCWLFESHQASEPWWATPGTMSRELGQADIDRLVEILENQKMEAITRALQKR